MELKTARLTVLVDEQGQASVDYATRVVTEKSGKFTVGKK